MYFQSSNIVNYGILYVFSIKGNSTIYHIGAMESLLRWALGL